MAGAFPQRFPAQGTGTDVPGLCCRADRRWRSQERPAHGGARRRGRLRPASSLHRQRRVGRRAT